MGVSLAWLAVALAASGPADSPREAGSRITYSFREVEVKGLGWREAGLEPVAQRGPVSVWTAPDDFLDRLADAAPEAGEPTVTVGVGSRPVHVTTRKPREFVTRVVWKGKDKPPKPVIESVREGLTATVIGRRLDQGVLAQVVVEDVDVRAVHAVAPPSSAVKQARAEAAEPNCPYEAMKARDRGDASVTVTVTATMDVDARPRDDAERPEKPAGRKVDDQAARAGFESCRSAVRIPEIGRASAAGEWLIPDGRVLVVGFGPHTVADDEGKAVVRERLALIAAEADDDEGPLPPGAHEIPAPSPDPGPVHADVPRAAAALPKLPGRTLPAPVHPDGTPAPMPHVPEDEAHAAEAAEAPGPMATPQTRKKSRPRADAPVEALKQPEPDRPEAPKVEPKVIKSSFAVPAPKKLQGLDSLGGLVSSALLGTSFRGAQFLVPLKPLALKLPLNQKLEFELIGRVVPDPDADGAGPFMVGN